MSSFAVSIAGSGAVNVQAVPNNAPPIFVSKIKGNAGDQTVTLNAEMASLVTKYGGGTIYIPGSLTAFVFNNQLLIPSSIYLVGNGENPVSGLPTRFDFSGFAGGATTALIRMDNVSDAGIRDIYITGRTTGSGAEIATTGACRRVSLVHITINTHTTGNAIEFSVTGSTIQSKIEQCTPVGAGTGIFIGGACTSIDVVNNYSSGCGSGYNVQGTYITLQACASDTNTLYGYILQNCVSVTVISCGAESNGRTAFYCTGASGVTFLSCRSVSNNTIASATIPSFMSINDSSSNITFIGCTDTTPNAATPFSVSTNSGALLPSILALQNTLPKGMYPNIVSLITAGKSSAAGGEGFNLPPGVAPSVLNNGALYNDGTHAYIVIGGIAKQIDN